MADLKESKGVLEHNIQQLNKENENLQERINCNINQFCSDKISEIEMQLKQALQEIEIKNVQNQALETLVQQLKGKVNQLEKTNQESSEQFQNPQQILLFEV